MGWVYPGVEFYQAPQGPEEFFFQYQEVFPESQHPGRLTDKKDPKTWKHLPVWTSALIAIWGATTKCMEGENYSFGILAVKENPNPGAFLLRIPVTFYSLNKFFK